MIKVIQFAAATAAVPEDLKEKIEFAQGNASELNAEKVAGASMVYWVDSKIVQKLSKLKKFYANKNLSSFF